MSRRNLDTSPIDTGCHTVPPFRHIGEVVTTVVQEVANKRAERMFGLLSRSICGNGPSETLVRDCPVSTRPGMPASRLTDILHILRWESSVLAKFLGGGENTRRLVRRWRAYDATENPIPVNVAAWVEKLAEEIGPIYLRHLPLWECDNFTPVWGLNQKEMALITRVGWTRSTFGDLIGFPSVNVWERGKKSFAPLPKPLFDRLQALTDDFWEMLQRNPAPEDWGKAPTEPYKEPTARPQISPAPEVIADRRSGAQIEVERRKLGPARAAPSEATRDEIAAERAQEVREKILMFRITTADLAATLGISAEVTQSWTHDSGKYRVTQPVLTWLRRLSEPWIRVSFTAAEMPSGWPLFRSETARRAALERINRINATDSRALDLAKFEGSWRELMLLKPTPDECMPPGRRQIDSPQE